MVEINVKFSHKDLTYTYQGVRDEQFHKQLEEDKLIIKEDK